MPLPHEAEPVIKARPGIVVDMTHVLLANESGRVPGLLHVLRKETCSLGNETLIVDHSTSKRAEPCEN
jgi:hypothetical protein